jgi:hypothetical protein
MANLNSQTNVGTAYVSTLNYGNAYWWLYIISDLVFISSAAEKKNWK